MTKVTFTDRISAAFNSMVASPSPDFTVVGARVVTFWGPWEVKISTCLSCAHHYVSENPLSQSPLKCEKCQSEKFSNSIDGNQGGFEVEWETKSAGCGVLTFRMDIQGKLVCETERMGDEFAEEVIKFMMKGVKFLD